MQSCRPQQQGGGKRCTLVSNRDFTSRTEHNALHCSTDFAHKWSVKWTVQIQLRKRQLWLAFSWSICLPTAKRSHTFLVNSLNNVMKSSNSGFLMWSSAVCRGKTHLRWTTALSCGKVGTEWEAISAQCRAGAVHYPLATKRKSDWLYLMRWPAVKLTGENCRGIPLCLDELAQLAASKGHVHKNSQTVHCFSLKQTFPLPAQSFCWGVQLQDAGNIPCSSQSLSIYFINFPQSFIHSFSNEGVQTSKGIPLK